MRQSIVLLKGFVFMKMLQCSRQRIEVEPQTFRIRKCDPETLLP